MQVEEENVEPSSDQLIDRIAKLELEIRRLKMEVYFLQEIIQEKNHSLGLG